MQDRDRVGDGLRAVPAAEAREQLSEIVNQVAYGKARVVLTRRGKPLVAIVPIADLELLDRLEELADLEHAHRELASAESERTVPWEEIRRRLGL